MAAAQQLARVGHDVHVFEREAKIGGLMRYGIPDFKMEKHFIDRRVEQMQGEGVSFHCNVNIGVDKTVAELEAEFDAIIYCGGAETPREAGIPGADLSGVHPAMNFLVQQNKRVGREASIQSVGWASDSIMASGKHVVVVGGGDTASDCVGTSFRQGAVKVTQLDIRPQPPEKEDKLAVWPYWATKMRTSSSQAEGAEREFQVATLEFIGDEGVLTHVKCCEVNEKREPIAGSEFYIRADLAFIAIGFAGPYEHQGPIAELGDKIEINADRRGNRSVKANDKDYKTAHEKFFVAGDARRGQSLVVWAIREGRQAARSVDEFLMGATTLPR
ncbi:MAG: glutamate synthase subunit beta [Ahrensia sp.]|nr:glutamate synthase subunit beta [Ahrensia sp.]